MERTGTLFGNASRQRRSLPAGYDQETPAKHHWQQRLIFEGKLEENLEGNFLGSAQQNGATIKTHHQDEY